MQQQKNTKHTYARSESSKIENKSSKQIAESLSLSQTGNNDTNKTNNSNLNFKSKSDKIKKTITNISVNIR